jgi:isopenicillin N synthase-like dioxygenase
VEPKESLEVNRRRRGASETTLEPLKELLLFTDLLHQVACTVRKCLSLPENVLLEDCASANTDTEFALDLLRLFYYDKVETTSIAMGSNEHTDWGAFTVVWQDQVGGLQTFCHACQAWVDVTPLPNESDDAVFVVHVGDMTSLCLGLALEEECPQAKDGEQPTVTWPSPKHRVVSPTESQRLSLVYFAYPPPTATMASMKEELAEWSRTHAPSCSVKTAFDDYYLLLNQSNEGKVLDPTETYTNIKSRPVGEVLREKWDQVQR